MIAAIYSRKSVFTEKSESVENQVAICKQYGRNKGITEFLVYEDEGFSGKNTDRPGFKKMMFDAKRKKFNCIISYRLDRFSRNVADFAGTYSILQKLGIDFISVREQFDTTSVVGRGMMNISAVFAQMERESTAERVIDNMLELAKTGRWLGGTPPLGYKSEPVKYIDVNKTLVYQKYLDDTCKTFHVEPPKTKQSYRKVPINSVCRTYLEKQIELKEVVKSKRPKQQNEYLFVTKFNTPINSQIYSDAIKAVIRQINLTRSFDNEFVVFSGHTFRHTFATRCFESGIEPKVVQSYLGHASLKMTMDLYTHVTQDKSSADIEKIVPESNNNIVEFKTKIS